MKNSQNFKNHARYYPLHHFIVTPLTIVYLAWTVLKFDFSNSDTILECLYNLLEASILVLLPFLVRIYALKLQNRQILNEMRLRYYHLEGKDFEEVERKLRLSQIIALRFASDAELLPLMEKAIQMKLSSKEIKKSIKHWKGDYRRV